MFRYWLVWEQRRQMRTDDFKEDAMQIEWNVDF